MSPVNRQDVLSIVESARNTIMARMVTKQDISATTDAIRTLTNLHQQNLQLLKQSEYQQSQLSRRIVALEARLVNLEGELRNTQQMLVRYADQPPKQIVVPVQPQTEQAGATQYTYRPAT